MGSDYKSVRLTEDAYETLARRKREEETFSEVVTRLASDRPISDVAGVFTDEEVERIRSRRRESYESYATNTEDRLSE
ncbi:RHH/copG family antitoxin [Halanaeroarchaeum sp. HSR-CO]|uniref:antitoxin VapB family protein n=1 Tax=Halanaeroarchaeum sp. HSR-CO TaxID=2866382 RepID=UPI00217F14E1|nr:antitoxin VapB family protein [Halanaeroarchaeum sp. HSR-CO]UWG48145.1 RHH/copG family antitoxin [Halanaeroarchaeum sp. HSR-CO]